MLQVDAIQWFRRALRDRLWVVSATRYHLEIRLQNYSSLMLLF